MISRLVALVMDFPIGEPAIICFADSTRSITLISEPQNLNALQNISRLQTHIN